MNKILNIMRLGRVQTAALTAASLIFGYLINSAINGKVISTALLPDLLVLMIVGFFIHTMGFVLNEYCDLKYDCRDPQHMKKPLVTGKISRSLARKIVVICAIGAFGLFHIYFMAPTATLIFGLSMVFGTTYDIYSKKIPGIDIALALWAFFFILAGASAASLLGPEAILLGTMGGLQILFNNQIEGGLKDVSGDHRGGARTLAIALGVRERKGLLDIPLSFKLVAWTIKAGTLALGGTVFIRYGLMMQKGGWIPLNDLLPLLSFVCFGLAIVSAQWFFLRRPLGRETLLKVFAVHEISSICFIYASSIYILPFSILLILLAVPLLWFIGMNRVLYRSTFIPQV